MTKSIAVIPKNSLEEIRIDLSEFNSHNLAGIRIFYDAGNDDWRPTKKGITIKITLLDNLIEALHKAKSQAQEQGWL